MGLKKNTIYKAENFYTTKQKISQVSYRTDIQRQYKYNKKAKIPSQ